MPSPRPTRSRKRARSLLAGAALLLLLGSCSSAASDHCALPPSWLASGTNTALAPLLGASIRHARAEALHGGTEPIPAAVRRRLAPYYDAELLDRVRWTTSSRRVSLDTVVTSIFPRYKGMTLGDVVVFADAASAHDISLWAHELVHVGQVRERGGIGGFSRDYLAHWPAMESESVERTNAILEELDVPRRQLPIHAAEPCRETP
ncbi:MAG: DUF4157 domain-containing protein [Porphyrobacter sp.]|nr:DUF4157 domain-containing protein [Porphyrobacter sp.]